MSRNDFCRPQLTSLPLIRTPPKLDSQTPNMHPSLMCPPRHPHLPSHTSSSSRSRPNPSSSPPPHLTALAVHLHGLVLDLPSVRSPCIPILLLQLLSNGVLQQSEDLPQLRVGLHLLPQVRPLLVRLRRRQQRAVQDHLAVLLQGPDEVERVVAQEDDQLVLGLAVVLGGLEDLDHLARFGLRDERVRVVPGKIWRW